MDWFTFIASIVKSLAWPGVVCFVIWVLRDEFVNLLPRLKKLKHNNTELEFTESIKDLEENHKRPDALPAAPAMNEDLHKQFNDIIVSAKLSPRAAIMEAWLKVESAAAHATIKAYPEIEENQLRGPVQPLRLLEGKVLTEDETKKIFELRRLRNLAAHDESFDLDGHPVEAYIHIALAVANKLYAFGS